MSDFDDKFYDDISKALDKMMKECYNNGVLAREGRPRKKGWTNL